MASGGVICSREKTLRVSSLPGVTELVTIVSNMSTATSTSNLSTALFGQTRRAILGLLYGHPDEAYYLRQLVRSGGLGLGAVQREVKRLTEAGILRRTARGNQVYYQANPECPLFTELKSLAVKTAGAADVLRDVLVPLADHIKVAFIYGSVARFKQKGGSDVDLMVIGDVSFGDVVSVLGPAQRILGREINPTVYSPLEFKLKLKARHHFLSSVLKDEKVFVIGNEHELARLGPIRVADRAQK
jgi:predicted nucleotidyltransferase